MRDVDRKWFRQHSIFLALQLCIAGWIAWLWFHLPGPGWAVAILAFVAAAMSVHGDMRGWQKAIWMILIGFLLVVELRAISKDRSDSDAKALDARRQQDLAFKGVRDTQDADFKSTAQGLTTAIEGIKSTLSAANTTIKQTRPHAAIRFDKIEFYPSAPSGIGPNTPYEFNFQYTNEGAETATDVEYLPKMYISGADDKSAQNQLVRDFEADWKTSKASTQSSIVPNTPLFGSIKRTFTEDEMTSFAPKKTIYFLLRF